MCGCWQDLHLAKRFYDKSLEALPDATVPVRLALASLALHSWCAAAPHLARCPADTQRRFASLALSVVVMLAMYS